VARSSPGAVGVAPVAADGIYKLQFSTQPLGASIGGGVATGQTGVPWAIQPVLSIYDDSVQLVTDVQATVTIEIDQSSPATGGPGSLSFGSGTTVMFSGGQASFSGCSIDTPGQGYQLTARTHSSGSTLVLTDTSFVFNIGGRNVPSRVTFTTQPAGAGLGAPPPQVTSGIPWATQPVVTVVNASGQRVRNDYGTVVSLSIDSSSQGSGSLCCAGGTSVTVAAGVASYHGCQIVGQTGAYLLRATGQSPPGAILYDISLPISSLRRRPSCR